MPAISSARRPSRVLPAAAALALAACAVAPPEGRSPAPTAAAAPAPPPAPTAGHAPPPATGPRIRFVPAGPDDLVPLVRAFALDARAEGRAPLVYVGATWCEPCRYFHAAAERGDLDTELPPLSLLEFDRDRDGARLDAAGYSSRMIPLFVVPEADGRPSARRIEGSIHGPGSPAEIVPRLRAMLAAP